MKKISLEQLLEESGMEDYKAQYQYICGMIENKRLIPIKSSPPNGKKPALRRSYWLVEDIPDYSGLIEELKYHISPEIKTDYYMNHLDVYQEEKKWVGLLCDYFTRLKTEGTPPWEKNQEPGKTTNPERGGRRELVSLNERSFQIWGREKFLQKEQGRKILAHCGVGVEQLGVYETTEPLAYYSASRKIPQTVLILENKDTFYSMRRHLMDAPVGQCPGRIFGVEVGTVVYGAGKGILRSYEDFRFCVEPHVNEEKNQILYFGDLDYEGIIIFERLSGLFDAEGRRVCGREGHKVIPFVQAYEKMVKKAEDCGLDFLPETSEKQNHNLSGLFWSFFPENKKDKMLQILEAGKYIPQEILNIMDF